MVDWTAPPLGYFTRFLGFRAKSPDPVPLPVALGWAFIGSFGGLAVLQAIFSKAHYFVAKGAPSIVASYGASAVLCFGVVESPLAQPRAVIGGHFLSALTGIILTLIFNIEHLQDDDPTPRLSWLAASLATAIAIVVMMVTKTTHPPAGATALMPVVDANINRLRWYFLPVVLLSSVMLVSVAMVTNNIQRRYPVFWWAPPTPPPKPAKPPSPQALAPATSGHHPSERELESGLN